MANNHTQLHATDGAGSQVALQHTSTDSPILPAENLARLQQIDPKLVDWVVKQTEIEGQERRKGESRVHWFIFIERILGVVLGATVALAGLGLATYVALEGHDWVAGIIAGGTLVTIVSVIVGYNIQKQEGGSKAAKPSPRRSNKKKP